MTRSLNITVALSCKYEPTVKRFDLIWMSCIKILSHMDNSEIIGISFAILVTVVVTTVSCVNFGY